MAPTFNSTVDTLQESQETEGGLSRGQTGPSVEVVGTETLFEILLAPEALILQLCSRRAHWDLPLRGGGEGGGP